MRKVVYIVVLVLGLVSDALGQTPTFTFVNTLTPTITPSPVVLGGNVAMGDCCCCGSKKAAAVGTPLPTPVPDPLFVTSCYVGNGGDDRSIITGIPTGKAGFTRICEFTAETGNSNNCFFKTPEMIGDLSCQITPTDFDPTAGFDSCTTDRIQSFGDELFEVGTAVQVNTSTRPYCWEQWGLNPNFHETFTYTGDGAGVRSIALGMTLPNTPDIMVIKGRGPDISGARPYIRIVGMPANVSYPISPLASPSDSTDHIRAMGLDTVEVGTALNQTGIVYYGSWWRQGPYLDVVTWTGNGASGGAGTCGSFVDQQIVTSGCQPVASVWAIASQANVNQPCTLSAHDCRHWRSNNVGIDVIGPGNLPPTNDFYAFRTTQPNNSGPGILGQLSNSTFTVTGGPTGNDSCNDINYSYFGFTTCAGAPIPGSQAAANWQQQMVGYWGFDGFVGGVGCTGVDPEVAGSPAINVLNCPLVTSGTAACGYPECDLTDTNTVSRDMVNKRIGPQSSSFSAASTQYLSCLLDGAMPCDEFDLGGAGSSFSIGCYARATTDADMTILAKGIPGSQYHFTIYRTAANDRFETSVRQTTGVNITEVGNNNTLPLNTWAHVGMVFDNTANTLTSYVNGAINTAGTAITNDVQTGASGNEFYAGRNIATGAGYWDGQLDDCFVYDWVLDATDWCKMCSCGVDGSACSCASVDLTQYVDYGYNHTLCGSCTLPACNATP